VTTLGAIAGLALAGAACDETGDMESEEAPADDVGIDGEDTAIDGEEG
jgi:hypothetical protein